MAGFTFDKPETQRITVTGWSDGRRIQFRGVFNTYTEQELKGIYAEIEKVRESQDATTANSPYFDIANRIMIGWVNDPEEDPSFWVCETEDSPPIDSTQELKERMLGQGSVAFCVVKAFYEARQSSEAQMGNLKLSPSRGFRDMAREANTKT